MMLGLNTVLVKQQCPEVDYITGTEFSFEQSTLNLMTLDNQRQAWATLGLSDQFARHIGVYAKGALGKLQYRVSMNGAATNNLQATTVPTNGGAATHTGRRLLFKRSGQNLCRIF
jgi:hypothetical protein